MNNAHTCAGSFTRARNTVLYSCIIICPCTDADTDTDFWLNHCQTDEAPSPRIECRRLPCRGAVAVVQRMCRRHCQRCTPRAIALWCMEYNVHMGGSKANPTRTRTYYRTSFRLQCFIVHTASFRCCGYALMRHGGTVI